MARLGLFINQKPEKAIQFDEDTEVLIAFVGKQELQEIQRKADKAARLGGADPKDFFNLKLAERAVKGWRKIGAPDHPGLIVGGEPFPFTEENRALLMKHSLDFCAFVNAHAVEAKEFLDDDQEELEAGKNG
ncbi:hypothetical protein [Desulfuromonas sp. TF]|uniref:hypothetical protein n=1 Tax=Desulfuromonas sp. TF TaxID=1232410 RepID=UPI00041DC26F|nr:hypothetical protein [Desulfuromonas sp. TF]